MTVRAVLQTAGDLPRSEAELLLAYVLKKERTWIIAHSQANLAWWPVQRFRRLAKRRRRREPLAYLRGEKEFYGRVFLVNPAVLIPRPSTEGLIDAALEFLQGGQERVVPIDAGIVAVCRRFGDVAAVRTVVDIGTGSGCIAITLAAERPDLHVFGTDISAAALRIAQENATRLGAGNKITWRKGDGLQPVQELTEPFLLISNPPYIPDDEPLMADVQNYEPTRALRGGPDGLLFVRQFMKAALAHPACRGVALECRAEQGNIVMEMAGPASDAMV